MFISKFFSSVDLWGIKLRKNKSLASDFHICQKEEKGLDGADSEIVEKEGFQTDIAGSEEMELNINHILEKIESFTQLVETSNTTSFP